MSDVKHLFIMNGLARKSKKRRKLFDRLLSDIERLEGDVEIQFTQPPEWGAEQIARAAAETGEPVRIYACGGDGTLNEVVNGAAGYENAAVTNVPLGTGNDFLKLFGPEYRALFSDVAALQTGPQSAFDLMDCNGRLGINTVCAGVDARIAADVDKYKEWPLVRGKGAYVLSLIENVTLRGIARPMRIQVEGTEREGETSIVCVCSGRYYGGGFMPLGDAMPDDGILDMLLVKKIGLLTFARFVGPYAKGKYRDLPDYLDHYHTQTIRYSSTNGEDIVTVVDGEVMRDTDFTVKLSEKKINFFYPEGASYQVR